MALAPEGTPQHAHATTGSALALPAFTTSVGAELFIAVTANAQSVSSISGGSVTWAKRKAQAPFSAVELWAAKASGAISGEVYTVNLSGASAFITLDIFAFSGQDTSTIWDGNASIPATNGTSPIVISTNNANDVLIYVARGLTSAAAASGWTAIGSGADFQFVQYKIVAATQSSLSVDVGTHTGSANGVIMDALMQASGGASSSLFLQSLLNGLQAGGPFFANPLAKMGRFIRAKNGSGLIIPERMAA